MAQLISNSSLDEIATCLVITYRSKYKENGIVNIENFIKTMLGCEIVHAQMVGRDSDKLGFLSDGRTPLTVFENSKVSSKLYPPYTIVLSTSLRCKSEIGRCRFTLAHEAGHVILEKLAASDTVEQQYKGKKHETEMCEMQANTIAAALLMPKFLIEEVMWQMQIREPIPIYGENVLCCEEKQLIRQMAETLKVSFTALFIRLKTLGYLEHRPIEEYVLNNLKFGGVASA